MPEVHESIKHANGNRNQCEVTAHYLALKSLQCNVCTPHKLIFLSEQSDVCALSDDCEVHLPT